MKLLKAFLGVQLSLILASSQAFAISGGPVFTSSVSLVGDYSGSLIPVGTNSLGLFSIGIPSVGVGTGPLLIFAEGRIFRGSIAASADPEDGSLTGVLNGKIVISQSNSTGSTGTSQSVSFLANAAAAGLIDANIAAGNSVNGDISSIRISGEAYAEISFDVDDEGVPIVSESVRFLVSGFKQSQIQTVEAEDSELF